MHAVQRLHFVIWLERAVRGWRPRPNRSARRREP